ncbi:hypothetical protein Desor_2314 [Desulfosporosinus orientis DSM 765]|uniref:Uncharacterized protein n=1 Tax=Desulfosporosinus orientis (strain ATCC 19365 / DSM 765 / NCIMB 8382 / VKM B-1628 / Singapore I) TaxID=768706 RepID=G7WDD8_DESOD|nr:hypothetical protein Desor_2314 [Desulfosporosinus orientis DSM 765]
MIAMLKGNKDILNNVLISRSQLWYNNTIKELIIDAAYYPD